MKSARQDPHNVESDMLHSKRGDDEPVLPETVIAAKKKKPKKEQSGPDNRRTVEKFVERKVADFYSKYDIGRKLGEGAFGTVYICWFKGTEGKQEKFALKMLDKRNLLKETMTADLLSNELKILSKAHHPNIVRMFDIS